MRESASSRPVDHGPSRGRLDHEVAQHDRGLGLLRGRGPAQDGADAGDDLGAAEGLDHVVVGADLEAGDAVELGSARREHDDRHLRGAAQLAAQVAPVPVGEREVEEDEVGRLAREARPRLGDAIAQR